jgi:hypothetical protein
MLKNNILFIGLIILLFIILLAIVYYKNLSEIKTIVINEKEYVVEIARSAKSQTMGLSKRESMGEIDGMLFIYENPGIQSFWMNQMKFDIDIVWIQDGKVVGIDKNISHKYQDVHYTSLEKVDMVLELGSGVTDKDNINIGDIVYF